MQVLLGARDGSTSRHYPRWEHQQARAMVAPAGTIHWAEGLRMTAFSVNVLWPFTSIDLEHDTSHTNNQQHESTSTGPSASAGFDKWIEEEHGDLNVL
jgi:hypothetical protein